MTRSKRQPTKYPWPLNVPSAPPVKVKNPLVTHPKMDRESLDLSTAHMWAGMQLLCEHYGIPWGEDSNAWETALLLRLCLEHVPYFRERSPKSKQWDLTKQGWLVHDVLEARGLTGTRRRPKRTVKGACVYLIAERRYRGAAESLETRYKEAIRPTAPLGWLRSDFPDDAAFLESLKERLPQRSGTK